MQRVCCLAVLLSFPACQGIHISRKGALTALGQDVSILTPAWESAEDKEESSELSIDLVTNAKLHLSFLKKVHEWSRGELYTTSPTLSCAVWRYKTKWLPLLKEISRNNTSSLTMVVVPPVDVAWIWHVHRLSSAAYAKFAKNNGLDTDAFDGAFQSQSSPESAKNAEMTRTKWQQVHGEGSPFFIEISNLPDECPDVSYLETTTGIPAASFFVGATERQGKFLWNYLAPNYEDEAFLRQSQARYVRFVSLYGQNPTESLVPSVPVDLMWHTHILSSHLKYAEDVQKLSGSKVRMLAHNDNVAEGKLKGGFQRTLDLWANAYGSSKHRQFLIGDSKHGGMSRGTPPKEYWSGILPAPSVNEASGNDPSSLLQSAAGCSSGCQNSGGGGDAGCMTDGRKPVLQSSAGCSSGCQMGGGGGGDAGCMTDGLKSAYAGCTGDGSGNCNTDR
eukprot:gnl/MRDRNA2_/MRDRNA2_65360_c0_seq1.p1 gnl/MRDRNA2_/MRDRNA2_65360_c0~~gnl/MRDRNA2_/MRDRNA2_65360_c0_seq1.p1  ORF type:complete len:447 (+),score=83.02 gnl/MRDRNA2_/MRDRNA2_65360_c0_seq1:99-1439(+)